MSIGSQSEIEIEIEIEIMKDMQPTLTYSAFPQAYTPAIKRVPRYQLASHTGSLDLPFPTCPS